MPDLAELLDPKHAALVTQECQKAVLGDNAVFPQLAEAARLEMIPKASRLAKAARAAQVPVVHCIYTRRSDGLGASTNARLFGAAKKSGASLEPGSVGAQVIDEIGDEATDIRSIRGHGIGPMWGTDLDSILRNLRVTTIIGVGGSVNVGITNLVMDAVNAGYQVVLPRDAIVGIPTEYADAVIDNTLSLLATVVATDDVLKVWS